MKKAKQIIFTLILIVSAFNTSKAQTISSVSDSSVFAPYVKQTKQINRFENRRIRKEYRQAKANSSAITFFFKSISKRTFAPQFSVDLLSNKGIHLFNTPQIESLPSINVGARIHAGIIINL